MILFTSSLPGCDGDFNETTSPLLYSLYMHIEMRSNMTRSCQSNGSGLRVGCMLFPFINIMVYPYCVTMIPTGTQRRAFHVHAQLEGSRELLVFDWELWPVLVLD